MYRIFLVEDDRALALELERQLQVRTVQQELQLEQKLQSEQTERQPFHE